MPIPARVAQWNKVGLNRVVRHVAPWAPGLGLIVHRGRTSGRTYQTPVNVFPTATGYLVALTYGAANTDWVKNVLAAGGCELRTRGRTLPMDAPRVAHYLRLGLITDAERAAVDAAREEAVALIEARADLFAETARRRWRPDPAWATPSLA